MLHLRNKKLLESVPVGWSWWNNWGSFHFATFSLLIPCICLSFSKLLLPSFFLFSQFFSLFLILPLSKLLLMVASHSLCLISLNYQSSVNLGKEVAVLSCYQISLDERSWLLCNAKLNLSSTKISHTGWEIPEHNPRHHQCLFSLVKGIPFIMIVLSRIPKMMSSSVPHFFLFCFLSSSKTVSENM